MLSRGVNRKNSACGMYGSTPCWESGFLPVNVPITSPQYYYTQGASEFSTSYYGQGSSCCSAPNCGSGNCGVRTEGRCAEKSPYFSGSCGKGRESVGYGRINRPSMSCGESEPYTNCTGNGKCGMTGAANGSYPNKNPYDTVRGGDECNFCK
jgi:hypothetical protein